MAVRIKYISSYIFLEGGGGHLLPLTRRLGLYSRPCVPIVASTACLVNKPICKIYYKSNFNFSGYYHFGPIRHTFASFSKSYNEI